MPQTKIKIILILSLLIFITIMLNLPSPQPLKEANAGGINETVGFQALPPNFTNIEVKAIEQPPEKSYDERLKSIEQYRNKFFPNSPVLATTILDVAIKQNFPEGFILAVGHNESHMGTKGRAVETKNPFNVGNTDCGDYKPTINNGCNNFLSDYEKGLYTFTNLIKNCYFNDKEEIKLETWMSRDFRATRCDVVGKRYMTDVNAKVKYLERIQNLKSFNVTY